MIKKTLIQMMRNERRPHYHEVRMNPNTKFWELTSYISGKQVYTMGKFGDSNHFYPSHQLIGPSYINGTYQSYGTTSCEYNKLHKSDLINSGIPNQDYAKKVRFDRIFGIFDSRELAEKAYDEFSKSDNTEFIKSK